MTTSDTMSGYSAVPPTQPPPAPRVLRRNRTNRVAAGVCSGLGDYFRLDPVLFRVLFATAAFFGGAGILAYLLAWATIPEIGTERAPLDGWMQSLRRRRFPRWLLAALVGLVLWAVAFSWWAPGPFFPVIAVVVLLVVFFGRRDLQGSTPERAEYDADGPTVNLSKSDVPSSEVPSSEVPSSDVPSSDVPSSDLPSSTGAVTDESPLWAREARAWIGQARTARRERRRRSLPLRIATVAALAATLIALGIADAIGGVPMQAYFWSSLGIVAGALLVGAALRRTPWSVTPLLVPALVGSIAFAGSSASLHDGVGQRQWRPTDVPASHYRLALGQGVLDLSALPAQAGPRTVYVTVGAGQVRIIAPKTLNITVLANIHFGRLTVDGNTDDFDGGVGLSRTVPPPAGASGSALLVDVHLADGEVSVSHP